MHLDPKDDKDKKGFVVWNSFELPQDKNMCSIQELNVEYEKDENGKKIPTSEHYGYMLRILDDKKVDEK